jgi:hypothetical protein
VMTSSAAESSYFNSHKARLPVAAFQTHPNVWEAEFCSDDCSFTNRFRGTVRADDPSGHWLRFQFWRGTSPNFTPKRGVYLPTLRILRHWVQI